MKASVFDIQRFSVHDGPGIRTTVFFRGCPLRCAWCHNPEGLSAVPPLQWMRGDCIGCGLCGERKTPDDAARCPTGALHVCGRTYEIDELFDAVLRDRDFYGDEGGVTCSGGECLLQSEAVAALLGRVRNEGIHTAIDTAGDVPWSALETVLPVCDLFLYDLKCADAQLHKKGTGVDNERILDNLRRLSATHANIALRVPVIPGFNADTDEMTAMARLAREICPASTVTLIPYHTLGVPKYESVGMTYRMEGTKPPSEDEMARYREIFRAAGVCIN